MLRRVAVPLISLIVVIGLVVGVLVVFGGDDAEPAVEVAEIPAGTTYVTLDAGFVEALGQLGLTPGTVGPAVIKNGSARFPITGGNVKYFTPGTEDPFVQGEINHNGSGLTLTAGDTEVALVDFVVDPGESVLTGDVRVNGELAKEDVELFFLDGRTLQPLRPIDDGAVLEGTTVTLKQGAAELLNETFGTDALAGGFTIGIAKIVVRTAVS
ncbi:MAG: hypothetical protein H0V81_03390 [Solirubrobacterales bacterium]|nr:hypothetical protein [Solirubrobacterales bacterium]